MVTIGPFQKLKSASIPSGERWFIAAAGTAFAEPDYVGEADGIRAGDFITATGADVLGTYFTSAAANDAWDALHDSTSADCGPLNRWLYHWAESTEFPTPPPLPDGTAHNPALDGWVKLGAKNGWLQYAVKIGHLAANPAVPDFACPPEASSTFGPWASLDHTENWIAWQRSLTGGSFASQTPFFQEVQFGPIVDLFCTPGTP